MSGFQIHNDNALDSKFHKSSILKYMWPSNMVGQEGNPVRVYVVDEDSHIRRVISMELMADPRTLIIGESGSLKCARKQLPEQKFDVMLLDLNLGDGDGLELIPLAKKINPNALIIIISIIERDDKALQAFELGAMGYLLKTSLFDDYVQAVLQVANGGASITPSLAKKLLLTLDKSNFHFLNSSNSLEEEHLSIREIEVLKYIATGYTSEEIGVYLKITTLTVNTHIRNIYHKLHTRTRAQTVNTAFLRGIL